MINEKREQAVDFWWMLYTMAGWWSAARQKALRQLRRSLVGYSTRYVKLIDRSAQGLSWGPKVRVWRILHFCQRPQWMKAVVKQITRTWHVFCFLDIHSHLHFVITRLPLRRSPRWMDHPMTWVLCYIPLRKSTAPNYLFVNGVLGEGLDSLDLLHHNDGHSIQLAKLPSVLPQECLGVVESRAFLTIWRFTSSFAKHQSFA